MRAGAALRADNLSVTNASVGQRLDAGCRTLQARIPDPAVIRPERPGLEPFVHGTQTRRPHRRAGSDRDDLPRTNNAMEGFMRSITPRYRRSSGRKHGKRYLLREGRPGRDYEASVRMGARPADIDAGIRAVPHGRGRTTRAAQRARQAEQLKQ